MKKITNKDKILTDKKDLTDFNLDEYHKKVVEEDEDYGAEYKLLNHILERFPNNTDPEIVAMKICLIDTTNSTNLSKYRRYINIPDLAKRICSEPNMDKWLSEGDLRAFEWILGPYYNKKDKTKKKLFSFASKYCCYHNNFAYKYGKKDCFAIYDTNIAMNLHRYDPTKQLTARKVQKWRDHGTVNDYNEFNDFVDLILKNMHTKLKKRKFDHFIWYQVKEQIEKIKNEREKHEMNQTN